MATTFGASGQTIQDVDILEYICGKNAISRTVTFVTDYRGKGNRLVDKYIEAGHCVFYNINYEQVKKSSSGDKLANPFPKDMEKYKNLIDPIFKYYEKHPNKDKIIWVCENEPTTKGFHSGPMSDYLRMLETFVELGHGKYGYKCIDGAVHVDRVLSAKESGNLEEQGDDVSIDDIADELREEPLLYQVYEFGEVDDEGRVLSYLKGRPGGSTQVAELLNGYAKIKNLYAVNLHTANIGGDFDSARIKKCTDKVKSWTGHNSLSNEWHVEKSNNPELLQKIAKGWHDAGVEHNVYLSGAGGDDVTLNSGMNLTPFGQAYRNLILVAKGAAQP